MCLAIINYNVMDKSEWTVDYKIFSGNIFRQKTYNKQNLSSYVHQKHWQLCPYFSQAYFLIASDEDSEYVFPEFAKKAKCTNKDGKIDSQVSEYWKSLFEMICIVDGPLTKKEKKLDKTNRRVLQMFLDISVGLTGHSTKKLLPRIWLIPVLLLWELFSDVDGL